MVQWTRQKIKKKSTGNCADRKSGRRVECGMKSGELKHRLTAARKTAGLSQYELATKSGVSRGTIAAIETGVHKTVKLDTIKALARAMGIPVEALVGEEKPLADDAALREFLASPSAQDITPWETRCLRDLRACGKRPTVTTYYIALQMLRTMKEA